MVRQDVIASVIFMVFLLFFTNLLIPELSLFGVAISMVIANAIRSFYLGIVFHQSSGIRLPELLFVRVKDLKWIILLLRRVIKV